MSDEVVCAKCSRAIRVGDDCFEVARGVLGTRGFINLEFDLLCSEECLEILGAVDQSEDQPGIPRSRRIP